MTDLSRYIRTIPDFPVPGIQFRDITTLFADADAFRIAVDRMIEAHHDRDVQVVAGLDARGFILGGAIAYRLAKPFVPMRKKGKLPGKTLAHAYSLEYGEAVMEIHEDAITAGAKVLLVDDLLATGGTAEAGVVLLEKLGGDVVGATFVIDLPDLGGAARLRKMGIDVHTLIAFEGD